jgi:hypothetical protein
MIVIGVVDFHTSGKDVLVENLTIDNDSDLQDSYQRIQERLIERRLVDASASRCR